MTHFQGQQLADLQIDKDFMFPGKGWVDVLANCQRCLLATHLRKSRNQQKYCEGKLKELLQENVSDACNTISKR